MLYTAIPFESINEEDQENLPDGAILGWSSHYDDWGQEEWPPDYILIPQTKTCNICGSNNQVWPVAVRTSIGGKLYKTGRNICSICTPQATKIASLFYLPYDLIKNEEGETCWTITLIKNFDERLNSVQ